MPRELLPCSPDGTHNAWTALSCAPRPAPAAAQYADASSYAIKFRQLQSRALAAVRSKVQQVLRGAAAQVQAAVREGQPGTPTGRAAAATPAAPAPADGAEAALLYVRFRAAAEPALKGLLQGIEQRAQQSQVRCLAGCCCCC